MPAVFGCNGAVKAVICVLARLLVVIAHSLGGVWG